MGRLVFGMIQSLDGYIAGPSGGPQSGGVYRYRQQRSSRQPVRSSLAISPSTSVAWRAFSAAGAFMRSCATRMRTSRIGTRSSIISLKSGVRSRSGLHHVH
jgi:hypothetical protein